MEKEECIHFHHDGCLYHHDFRSCKDCNRYHNPMVCQCATCKQFRSEENKLKSK